LAKSLNNRQREAIEEVFNIGLGRAAMTLGKVAQQEIMLSAANIHLSNINTGQTLDTIKKSANGNWVSVSQVVVGDIDAVAMVIFSDMKALQIISKLVGQRDQEIGQEYEPEMMTELANIILNACISAMSNMMNLSLESYLPVHHIGDAESVMLDSAVLPMKILVDFDMIIGNQVHAGFITFSVDMKSLQKMLQFVEQYLEIDIFEWVS
jgi:chemotaxis protein CheC